MSSSTTTRKRNRHFPLHWSICSAAVREMLLLEGTLSDRDLAVKTADRVVVLGKKQPGSTASAGSSQVVPRYLLHMNPERYDGFRRIIRDGIADEEEATAKSATRRRKRKTRTSTKTETKRKSKKAKKSQQKVQRDQTATAAAPASSASRGVATWCKNDDEAKGSDGEGVPCSAECLVNLIVERSVSTRSTTTATATATATAATATATAATAVARPPRKVSDLDTTAIAAMDNNCFNSCTNAVANADPAPRLPPDGLVFEQTLGPTDISRFWVALASSADGSTDDDLHRKQLSEHPLCEDIPELLEASIATEANLRGHARHLTAKLVSTFDDDVLRTFVGYKTPNVTRDKLVRVVADYLFDTSHAMFAWQQTEREVRANRRLSRPSSQSAGKHEFDDALIKESLFDSSRALRKIGGFEDSSLLPHAISITRLRNKNRSWREFATTAEGIRMLEHHRNAASLIAVGQRRRGQRLRQRLGPTRVDEPSWPSFSHGHQHRQVSRPSSVASVDAEMNGSETLAGDARFSNELVPVLVEVPSTLNVHIQRSQGSSWGILLAKEGEMCVVVRSGKTAAAVKSGDLLLRVENERGESASSPSFLSSISSSSTAASNHQEKDWFLSICDLFKNSEELNLVVQRVAN